VSAEEKYNFPYDNMRIAGKAVSDLFGLEPLSDIEKIDKNARKCEFQYANKTCDGILVRYGY